MLVWFEGMDNGKQVIKDRGYDVIVGGQLFKSYVDYLCVLVDLLKFKIQFMVVGCYQLLCCYYDVYKKMFGFEDFFFLSQDLIVLQQICECCVLLLIQVGKIWEVIKVVSNIWVSLLGVGYGQYEYKIVDLLVVYCKVGGMVVL